MRYQHLISALLYFHRRNNDVWRQGELLRAIYAASHDHRFFIDIVSRRDCLRIPEALKRNTIGWQGHVEIRYRPAFVNPGGCQGKLRVHWHERMARGVPFAQTRADAKRGELLRTSIWIGSSGGFADLLRMPGRYYYYFPSTQTNGFSPY